MSGLCNYFLFLFCLALINGTFANGVVVTSQTTTTTVDKPGYGNGNPVVKIENAIETTSPAPETNNDVTNKKIQGVLQSIRRDLISLRQQLDKLLDRIHHIYDGVARDGTVSHFGIVGGPVVLDDQAVRQEVTSQLVNSTRVLKEMMIFHSCGGQHIFYSHQHIQAGLECGGRKSYACYKLCVLESLGAVKDGWVNDELLVKDTTKAMPANKAKDVLDYLRTCLNSAQFDSLGEKCDQLEPFLLCELEGYNKVCRIEGQAELTLNDLL